MSDSKPKGSLESRIKWERLEPFYNPEFARFPSRRSTVFGTKGMVACSEPLAAAAGMSILEAGGNAADAAVAVAAALNMAEPCMCGIGGDAFCLFWNEKEKTLKGLNGSGRSPAALNLAKARELGIQGKEIPLKNINSVTVPGSCAAWEDTIKLFGSGTQTLASVLAPAIRLGEEGFPVSELTSRQWCLEEQKLKQASENGDEMLLNGKGPKTGEIMKNVTLAKTFREVAEKGRDGFYTGRVAEEIVKLIKSKGGVMELSDLASHTSTPVDPISYTYHASSSSPGITLHEIPPNGQGLTALVALGILQCLEESGKTDLQTVDHNGVEWLHVLIESLRLAFADTRAYVADPDKVSVPVKELLNNDYLKRRAALVDMKKSTVDVNKGSPWKSQDTVYFTTADKDGNACSFIMSNYAGFGTGAVPKGCGFTLQNRGSNFILEEGHPNCLDGNKRPYHTIIPAMVTKGDELFMSFGVMGGFMQPQGHIQVLLNMLHRGFHAQAALDAPRFCISAGMPDATDDQADAGDINSEVFFEEGIAEDVVAQLGKMGHDVHIVKDFGRGLFGRGQVIQRLGGNWKSGNARWAAGSDMSFDATRGAGGASGAGGSGRRDSGDGTAENPEAEAMRRLIDGLPKSGPIQTTYDDKLLLYSLYKQSTEGNVKTSRPGLLDMLGRAKWDAWNKRKDLKVEDAKRLYVDSLVKIFRTYRDSAQAVAFVRELESFTADPRDLVQSGHSLSDPRQSSSLLSSEDDDGDSDDASSSGGSSSAPPASLGPYVSKSQLPAPIESQRPPSDLRSVPDSVTRHATPRGRRTDRGDAVHLEGTEEESETESNPDLHAPSQSARSAAVSYTRSPPPPPLPPQMYSHQSRPRPTMRTHLSGPGKISGVSTPHGAGTPLRHPPGRHSLPTPQALGLPPPPPSNYSASLMGGGERLVYMPGGPVIPAPGPSVEQSLDRIQIALQALTERVNAVEARAGSGPSPGGEVNGLGRTLQRLLFLLGLTSHPSSSTASNMSTTTRLFVALITGLVAWAKRVAVDAILVVFLVRLVMKWRRGDGGSAGFRGMLREMLENTLGGGGRAAAV